MGISVTNTLFGLFGIDVGSQQLVNIAVFCGETLKLSWITGRPSPSLLIAGISAGGGLSKTTKTMLIVLGSFQGFYTPNVFHSNFIFYTPELRGCVGLLLVALLAVNTIVNPLINVWMNKDFKIAFKNILGFKKETLSLGRQSSRSQTGAQEVSRNSVSYAAESSGH